MFPAFRKGVGSHLLLTLFKWATLQFFSEGKRKIEISSFKGYLRGATDPLFQGNNSKYGK